MQSDVDFLLCFRQKPGAVRVVSTRALFLCFTDYFATSKLQNKRKMQKNEKKMQKNLHVSKKSCTFAPNLKNNPISNPKN